MAQLHTGFQRDVGNLNVALVSVGAVHDNLSVERLGNGSGSGKSSLRMLEWPRCADWQPCMQNFVCSAPESQLNTAVGSLQKAEPGAVNLTDQLAAKI